MCVFVCVLSFVFEYMCVSCVCVYVCNGVSVCLSVWVCVSVMLVCLRECSLVCMYRDMIDRV